MRRLGRLSKWWVCAFGTLALGLLALGCSSEGGSGQFSQEFEKADNLPKPKKVLPVKPDSYSDLSPREKRALKQQGK